MHPPIFSNRPNRPITLPEGEVLWHSRSVAIVAQIIAEVGGAAHVLLNQRGPACPDHVGLWCLPCGYLDWDESAPQAVRREAWEETGLDVLALEPQAGSLTQPWQVFSDPQGDARQNVVLHYGVRFCAAALPPVTTAHAMPGECTAVGWWPIERALQTELAFGHQRDIAAFLATLQGR